MYLKNNKLNSKSLYLNELNFKLRLLKGEIIKWENNYLLKSIKNGTVFFPKEWTKDEKINLNDLVFVVVPNNNIKYKCKIKISIEKFSKLKVGQQVTIHLIGYNYSEYGYLKGNVDKISLICDNNNMYNLDVSLENNLTTTNNKDIIFRQEIEVTAKIIVEDLRLIERVFYRFKQIFNKI